MQTELVIGDHTPAEVTHDPSKGRGLVPRDYSVHPVGYACPPMREVNIPLIPRAEWPERIRAMEATQSRLSDIRARGNGGQPIPSLNQGQVGYCWAHSTTHAVMLVRAAQNQPYVPLSAYAVAATIKGGRDEGGWGALSMEFVQQKGIPGQSLWPQGDRNYRQYAGRQDVWDSAALHKVTEGWIDLDAAVYARDLTFDQMATLLLSRVPVVSDFNWWSHSVCSCDLVNGNALRDAYRAASGKLMAPAEFDAEWGVNTEAAGFGDRIWNSWGDAGFGTLGMGVLTGSKAIPDGAVAPLVTRASAA